MKITTISKLKTAFYAGAASMMMLTGCTDSTDRPVARNADDEAAYQRSRQADRAMEDINRDTPGTYATPREDQQDDKRLPDDKRVTDDKRITDDTRLIDAAKITGDAQVLGMLSAIDKHEMHASGEALAKQLSAPVKEFSEMLHKDHVESLEKINQTIKNLDLTLSIPARGETLMKDGKSKVTDMSKLNGVEFERAYMAAMVQGHTDAVKMIDEELLPAAKDQEVVSHLKAAREKIGHHLKEAQRIHGELSKP